MRTITNLMKLEQRVYVYLCNDTIRRKFLLDAENEGFSFGDGEKPTLRSQKDNIYAVNAGRRISFVGWAGHMAFHNPKAVIGGLIRIDYEKYILGFDDYTI